MKNLKIISASAILLFVAFAFKAKNNLQQVEIITLEKAIKDKIITASFVSNGAYSGNSIECNLKNLKGKAIKIQIPEGSYFEAPSKNEQDLIVPQAQFALLNPNQNKALVLNGFCTNLSNSAPKSGGIFKLTATTLSAPILKLLTFLKGKKYDSPIIRDAIWSLTNASPISNIDGENNQAITDLKKELFAITAQKETWYTSPQITTVNEEDRSINRETAAISGELKYETKKGAKVHTEVFSPEGEVKIKTTDRVMQLGGNLTFNFKVEVKGWKKGTYKVKVIEDSKVIKSYDFVV